MFLGYFCSSKRSRKQASQTLVIFHVYIMQFIPTTWRQQHWTKILLSNDFISFIMCQIHHDRRMNERMIKTMNIKWKKTKNRMVETGRHYHAIYTSSVIKLCSITAKRWCLTITVAETGMMTRCLHICCGCVVRCSPMWFCTINWLRFHIIRWWHQHSGTGWLCHTVYRFVISQ